MFVQVSRSLLLLGPFYPADVVVCPLAAVRTREIRLFYFLPFVKNIAFVHMCYSHLLMRVAVSIIALKRWQVTAIPGLDRKKTAAKKDREDKRS